MEKQGFLDQLENIITEFKRYEITPEILRLQQDHLNQYVHKEPGEVALANKLEDLIYIYEKLMQSLQDNYIDSEDQLQLLAEKINDTDFLNDAEVYIDGFHNFTPIELSVIETLMKKCKQVTVLLTVDQPTEEKSDLDLFYKTSETYHTLQSIAQENNINIEETITLQPENGRFKERPYFLHLEQHFNETPSPAYQGQVPIKLAERSEEHTSELQSRGHLVCRLLLEKKKSINRLENFVAKGGALVMTYISGVVNENDLTYVGGWHYDLQEIFGINHIETDTLDTNDKN